MNKIIVKLLVGLFLFVGTISANGQSSANYTPGTATNGSLALDINSNVVDMTTGTTLISSTSVDQGVNGSAINIGFDFWMMGNRYTQFNVTTNGLVSLSSTSTSASGSTYVVSGGTVTTPIISAFAADLGTGTSGKTHYKIVGTAPNRCLVIEFNNMTLLWTNSYTNDGTYQVRLYESTGAIEFVYGSMSITSTASASDNTVGIGFATNTTNGTLAWINSTTNASSTVAPFTDNAVFGAGPITNLNSAANGSRRIYNFIPPSVAPATALNFTGVGSSGMTVNWTASSPTTNVLKYALYSSTDGGVNYSFVNTTNVGTNTLAVTGLSASTTYTWKVVALSEGALSTVLTGSQATLAPQNISSTGAGGLWSSTATWVGGVLPGTSDNAIIVDGATVTIDMNPTVGSLTVGGGTSGILQYDATVRTLTVGGNVTVNAGAAFLSAGSGSTSVITTHALSIGGNLTNNGILNFSATAGASGTTVNASGVNITFTGAVDATFDCSNANAITNLRSSTGVTLNKGTSSATLLNFIPTITYTSAAGATSAGTTITVGSTTNLAPGMYVSVTAGTGVFATGTTVVSITNGTTFVVSTAPTTALSGGATVVTGSKFAVLSASLLTGATAGFLSISNGTFKIGGSNTFNHPYFNATAYSVPANGGIWLNNSNAVITGQNGSPTMSGLLRMTAGTYNVGTSSGNAMGGATNSVFIIEGGTMNFTGRMNISGASASFTMSAGTINATTVGNASSSAPGFGFTTTTSVFNMSGGTINLVQASTAATPVDYQVSSVSTITGGTLNVGTSATATNFVFRITGATPNLVIDNTTNNKTANIFASTTSIVGNVTINTGTSLNLNGFTTQVLSNGTNPGSVLNNGSIVGTVASSRLDFAGGAGQTYSGTGTFGTNAAPIVGSVGIANLSNVTLNSPIITNRINLFRGTAINSNQFSLGATGNAAALNVQRGGGGAASGSFDVAPTFNLGTGTLGVIYFTATTGVTTGFEIPATRTVNTCTINNAFGVTLAGGNLSIGTTLTLTLGLFNTSTLNIPTITSSTTGSVAGFSPLSYVNGTLARTFAASLAGASTYDFPVGTASSYNNIQMQPTTTASASLAVAQWQAVSGATGGTPDGVTINFLPTDKYWSGAITANAGSFTSTIYRITDGGLGANARMSQSATQTGVYAAISPAPVAGVLTSTAQTTTNFIVIGQLGTTISGTKTVCPGGGCDYTSLTAAGGAFADINSKIVNGNITLQIAGNLAIEDGTNALNEFTSPYTITIKPTGSARTITGSAAAGLITLNGADRVTIDGSLGAVSNTVCPASAASRDLTISNTNVGTSSAVIWIQTVAAGPNSATNNTVMNCNVSGSGPAATLVGIGCGSSTVSVSGLGNGNNNNSIINNNISSVQYGVYSMGTSATNKNQNTIINQNQMNTASPNNIGLGGILAGFENNLTISGNNIAGMAQSGADAAGINVGFGAATPFSTSLTGSTECANVTITKNIIGSIVNTGTFSAVGIALGGSSATLPTGTNLIANNMVSGVNGNGTSGDLSTGLLIGHTFGALTRVYNNSVTMQGTIGGASAATQVASSFSIIAAFVPDANTYDIRNNIFSNTQLGNAGATLRLTAISSNLTAAQFAGTVSNNNDLYATGAGPGTYAVGQLGSMTAGTLSTTLANWQTNSAKDANSRSALPVFISSTDLHLSAAVGNNLCLESKGANLASVTDDIDCQSRNNPPDIGADEFTAVGGTATPSSQTKCSGIAITTIGLSGATSYAWTRDNGALASGNVQGIAASGSGNISGTLTNTTATPQTVTFTITATDANGCTGPFTATVLVNPTPNASATNNSQTICSGATIATMVITGAVSGTTFNWTRDNGDVASGSVQGIAASGSGDISGTLTNTTFAAVTVTFTITPTANGCPGTPITTQVVVKPTPDASATNNAQTICSGATIATMVITGNVSGTTFNWTRDNGDVASGSVQGIAASGSGDISGTLTNTTSSPVTVTFTITPTAAGCPGAPITATVLVNPTPDAFATNTPQNICSGATIATIAITGGVSGTTFNWTRNNLVAVPASGGAIAASGSGDISGFLNVITTNWQQVQFTITPTANGCPGADIFAYVSVYPIPDAVATPSSQTICSGATITTIAITGSVPLTTFNWTRDNGDVASGSVQGIAASGSGDISGALTNTTASPVTVTFTITPTADGCPGSPITATVLVNPTPPTPTITPSGPTTFCAGGSVTLTSSAASGNQWYESGNPIGGETNTTLVVTASGNYSVIETQAGCSSAPSLVVSVTVTPLPPTPTITPGGPTTFCAGGSVTLTSSAASGNQWYINGNPIGGETNQTYVATASGNYTVVVTALGCPSAPSAPTTVTVNPIPPTPTITPGGPTTFCTGGSVTLTSSSASGNQWYLNGNPIGGATNQNYSATASGNYTVLVTLLGCSSAASSPTSVTVNPIPATPTITPGGPTTFCAGGSVTLTSSAASGNQWYINGNPIGGATNQNYSATASGNYTVVVTVLGCSSAPSAPTAITVNPIPPTPTITPGGPTTFCAGGGVVLSSSSASGNQWYLNGNPIGGATSQVLGVNFSGDFTVIVTQLGCSSAASSITTVTVKPNPTLSGTQVEPTTCVSANGSINLTVSGAAPGPFTYNWSTANGSGLVNGQEDQTGLTVGTYDVTVTSSNGCSANTSFNLNGPGGCAICPTMGSLTASPSPVCVNVNTTLTQSGLTSMGITYGIQFKYSLAALADPYVGGTVIATVPNGSLTGGGTTAATTTSFAVGGNYFIYTILSPTPGDPSCRPSSLVNLTVNATSTWTGTVSNNWFTAGNWSCSAVPNTASDVLIPSGTPFSPVIGAGTAQVHNLTINSGATLTNNATLNMNGGGSVTSAGTYTGTGTFTGAVYSNNGGIVAPGGSPGCMVFGAGYTNGTGTEVIEIGGTTACTQYDQLQVTGTATLSGTLDVQLYLGYTPSCGESYKIMTSTTLVGTFGAYNFPALPAGLNWNIQYNFPNPGDVTLSVFGTPTAVATPSSQTICSGTAITTIVLTGAVAGTTYNWTRDNNVAVTGIAASGSGDISGTLTNTTNAPVTVTFTITPVQGSCTGTPVTATVTVNPIPDVNQPASQVVCNNTSTAPVNFTGAVAGTTFSWTNNTPSIGLAAAGTGNISSFAATNPGTSPVTATITVTPSYSVGGGGGGGLIPELLYYKFDGAGTSVPNLASAPPAGTATATLMGALTQGGSAICGGTIIGTGNSSTTDYLNTNWAPNLGLGQSWTISFKSENIQPSATLYYVFGDINTSSFRCFTNGVAGPNNWILRGAGLTDIVLPGGATTAPHTNTFVYDAALNQVRAYLDGVLVATVGQGAVNMTGTGPLKVNGYSINVGSPLNGHYDEFCLFNRAITPAEVTTLAGPCPAAAGGCVGTPKNFTITVNPTPNAVATPSSQVICSAATITTIVLSGNVAGTVYNWTRDNNATVTGIAASGSGNISGALTNTTNTAITVTFTITPSYTNAGTTCLGTPVTATVLVNPTPDVNQPANQVVCNNTSTAAVNFSGTVPGTIFNWTNTTPSIGLAASGTGNIAPFTAINAGTTPVVATVTVTPQYVYAGSPVVVPFGFTGGMQTWTVPAGVTSITIDAYGAGGGAGSNGNSGGGPLPGGAGGKGTKASGTLAVTPGQVLNIFVGGAGTTGAGGFNGGAAGGNANAGGGGGATDVRYPGTTTADRIIVGGGGGGGGRGGCESSGGAGGTGGDGDGNGVNGGDSPTSGGVAGGGFGGIGAAGGGGAGIGCGGFLGAPGVAGSGASGGVGGNGQTCCCFSFGSIPGGGGGGGGFLGGNGGGGGSAGTAGCSGNDKGAGGGGAGGTSYTGGVTAPATTAGVQTGDGQVVITYAIPSFCPGSPKSFTITVNPTPNATATPSSQTVCSGAAITTIVLSGSVAGTVYNWTRDNSGTVTGIAASGAGNISGTLTNTTNVPITVTFTITPSYTNAGVTCTGAPITATVLVNPTPNAVATPSSQTSCSGTAITTIALTGAVSGTTFNWTRDNTVAVTGIAASGSGNISGTLTNTTTSPVTVTFTITPTANSCPGTPITATVVVNPTPNAVATPSSQTRCSGVAIQTIVLTGNVAGTVFNWTRDNGTLATGNVTGIAASGSGNISGTLTNTTNIPLTVTFTITPSYTNAGATCNGTPITATVLVNPTPNATATPSSQTTCSGTAIQTIVLTGAVSGTTFNWTRDNTVAVTGIAASGSGNISGTLTNTTNAAVTVTFTITPTANGCAGTPITATVVVNPIPNAVATPASQTVCSGVAITTIVLSGNVAGTVYNWTRDNAATVTGIAASGSGNISGTLTNTTNIPITVTFTITPSYTNAGTTCLGTPITATVLVNPTPNATAAPASQVICSGSAITPIIPSGNVAGTVFNWTRDNVATVTGMPASGSGTISGSLTNTTNAPVTVTFTITPTANGCTGPSFNATVVVNPIPNAVATPSTQTICSGSAITTIVLSGNVAGTVYTWTRDNNVNVTGIAASGTGNISGTLTNGTFVAQTVTFTITPSYTNAGVTCVGPTTTATVIVNPIPNAVATPSSQTICSGNAITTIVMTGNVVGTVYNWTRDNGDVASGLVQGIAASGSGNISGTLTNTTGVPITVTFFITPSYTNAGTTCTGPMITATVLVNPTPNVTATPSSQTICSGSAITPIVLTGTVAGTTYTWVRDNVATVTGIAASGSGSPISGTLTNTTNAPVTVTFTITPSANSCPGTPTTATVVVNPIPNAVATPSSQTVCSGNPITTIVLTGNVAGTVYNWTRDNIVAVTGIFASGTGNISGTPINNTNAPVTITFTITPTYTNAGVTCTGPSITATVLVNPTPIATATPASQSICSGAAITPIVLTSTIAGTTYAWTRDNTVNVTGIAASGTSNPISGTLTNNTAVTQVVTFTITPTANGCAGPSATATVTVYPPANVNQPPNQVVCNGSATQLVHFTGSVPGTIYNWTNNNTSIGLAAAGSGDIPSFIATNTGNAPQVATITVTPTANGCPGTPVSFTITVNPTPVVNAVPNQVVCNNTATAAVNFSSPTTGGTIVYNWTHTGAQIGQGPDGVGNIPSFTAINTTGAPITATFTVIATYTNGGVSCVSQPVSFTITVNPTPVANQQPNQVVCHNTATAAVNFTGNVAGAVYNWTNSAPSIGLAASGTGNIASFTATNATGAPVVATITVTPTYTNAAVTCTGPTMTFTITVNPVPTVNAVANQAVCNGAPTAAVTFSGNAAGTVYNWTNNNTSIGLAAAGTGNIPSFTAINTGTAPVVATITVTPTFTNAGVTCTGTPVTFTITVNPTPTVNAVANQTLCNGATTTAISFTGAVAGTTFNWTNNNTSIGLAASGTGNIAAFTATNTTSSPVTATITVTPTANGCPGTPVTFTITVNPTPVVAAVANQTLCAGASTTAVNFTSLTPGTTYAWTNSNTAIGLAASGTGNIPGFVATNAGVTAISGTITVTPSANGCTGAPITFTITVNPKATVAAVASQTLCNGAATAAVNFVGTVAGTIFNWTNSNTAIGLAASGQGNIPSFTATNNTAAPISATITVTPTTANGCTGTQVTFTITVNPTPTVNAIANQSLCEGGTTTAIIFSGATTGTVFTWTNSNTAIGLPASGSGNINPFVVTNGTGSTIVATITVTGTASGCTSVVRTFTITVFAGVNNIVITNAPLVVCLTDTIVQLRATPPGGTWSGRGVSGSLFNAALAGTGTHTLTYTLGNGTCLGTASVNVTVRDCPERHNVFANAIHIYPNPNGGQFNIRYLSDVYKAFNVRIIDADGHVVRNYSFTNLVYGSVIPFDLRMLPSATYFLEVYNEFEKAAFRVVIMH